MKAVALLCVLVVAASALEFQSVLDSNPFAPHMNLPVFETMGAAVTKAEKIHAALQTVNAFVGEKPVFGTLALSAGCQTAVDALSAMFNSGACMLLPNATSSQAQLGAFCTGTCATSIGAKVDAITTACVTADDLAIYANVDFAANLRKASGMIKAICVKAGDKYCLPSLQQAGIQLNLNDPSAASAQLTTVCTDACLMAMVQAASIDGDRPVQQSAMFLSLICVKVGDTYCFPKLQSIGNAFSQAQTTKDYSAMCDPCFTAIITKMITLGQTFSDDPDIAATAKSLGAIGPLLRALCMKNGDQLCVNLVFNTFASFANDPTVAQNGATCPDTPTATSPCPDTCKSVVGQLKGQLGCCLPGLFLFLNLQTSAGGGTSGTSGSASAESDLPGFMKAACGIDPGQPCTGKIVKVVFVIQNLKYSYYTANKVDVETRLKADLALNFGVTPADITINSITDASAGTPVSGDSAAPRVQAATTAGLKVDYTITPTDSSQADAIQTQITSGATVTLPNLGALPLSARDQPAQGVAVDASSTQSTTAAAGVAALKASVLTVLAAAALAFFAMRR